MKKFFRSVIGLRSVWNAVKGFVSGSPREIMSSFEPIAVKFCPDAAEMFQNCDTWNDFKRCGSREEAKKMALNIAQDKIDFFKGKSEEEIDEYVKTAGKSMDFL